MKHPVLTAALIVCLLCSAALASEDQTLTVTEAGGGTWVFTGIGAPGALTVAQGALISFSWSAVPGGGTVITDTPTLSPGQTFAFTAEITVPATVSELLKPIYFRVQPNGGGGAWNTDFLQAAIQAGAQAADLREGGGGLGPVAHAPQGGHQDGHQQGNDTHHHQQLHQCEPAPTPGLPRGAAMHRRSLLFHAHFALNSCHVRGAEGVRDAIARELGIDEGGTTDDLRFSFETVHCLGCCGLAPVVMVDEDIHGKVGFSLKDVLERYQ